MRIIVLTAERFGIASLVIPELIRNKKINIVGVIYTENNISNRAKRLKRIIKKISRIGLLGALNGLRLRTWYKHGDVSNIQYICKNNNILFSQTEYLVESKTINFFKQSEADLGLSLGNGYIPKKIFNIPKYGMINIHTELVPQFRGALDIIWPIYEQIYDTGFTIHQISEKIDKGNILFQKKTKIKFYPSLKETVINNRFEILPQIPKAFSYVCENYLELSLKSEHQGKGKFYTTPTFSQFLRMVKNNKLMYKEMNQ